jgi:hypothetical protein
VLSLFLPGPPVITSAFVQTDRSPLTVGKLQTAALFDPAYSLLFVDPWPGQPAIDDADQPIGDRLFGPVEACQEGACSVAEALSRCYAKSAIGLGLTDFQAAATASRHVVIAAARSTR